MFLINNTAIVYVKCAKRVYLAFSTYTYTHMHAQGMHMWISECVN